MTSGPLRVVVLVTFVGWWSVARGDEVDDLLAKLRGNDARARQTAAFRLGDFKQPDRIVGPLSAALKDPDDMVRMNAAAGLGKLGDARAAEPLVAALQDPNINVAVKAAEGLKMLRAPQAVPLMIASFAKHNPVLNRYVTEAFMQIGPAAAPALIAALKDPEVKVRRGAALGLRKVHSDDATEPLLAALKDPDATVRSEAIQALAHPKLRGNAPIGERLVALLNDPELEPRTGAVIAVGEFQERRAVGPLLALLPGCPETAPADAIATALGRIGDPQAVEPLIGLLGHGAPEVRLAAVQALGILRDPRAIERLCQVNNQDNARNMRETSWAALAAINQRAVAQLASKQVAERRAAVAALIKLHREEAVLPLVQALKDQDAQVRAGAATALGLIRRPAAAVKPLIGALKDPDRTVREQAIVALGDLEDASAREPLTALLKGADAATQQQIQTALGKLKPAPQK